MSTEFISFLISLTNTYPYTNLGRKRAPRFAFHGRFQANCRGYSWVFARSPCGIGVQ